MPNDCISYQDSGYFSPLIKDYLDRKPGIEELYNRFPNLENFKAQIDEKQANFTLDRTILTSALQEQYQGIDISAATSKNIEALKSERTFTITTGHQLNLFTGPLYFLYKIVSTINLTRELKSAYPDYDFVPVYWMATEDHDFEEINYFNFKGRKFRWNRESGGPVGRLSTEGLDEFFNIFSRDLGAGQHADQLRTLFRNAYLEHKTLSEATRYLANALFGEYGLVILDADDRELKRQFAPFIREELLHQVSFDAVKVSIDKMIGYDIQVNPREINLFYIENGLRERIIFENGKYNINNTSLAFTERELLEVLEASPQKFSPNVILRPLYEEVILPNLCYIGGGGEIAYWLELKRTFEKFNVTFPILLVRNSVLLATAKHAEKADKLGLGWKDLFLKPDVLANDQIRKHAEFPIDLSAQKEFLRKQFELLHDIAKRTDPSFTGAVKAQETKQINGLENLEKRLLKAEKRKHAELLGRMTSLQGELFPNGGLQERFANFAEFYLVHGEQLVPNLTKNLRPLENTFNVIVL
jgi:bacillithiol biosynthesis cysteine-adding enzyme BshC